MYIVVPTLLYYRYAIYTYMHTTNTRCVQYFVRIKNGTRLGDERVQYYMIPKPNNIIFNLPH